MKSRQTSLRPPTPIFDPGSGAEPRADAAGGAEAGPTEGLGGDLVHGEDPGDSKNRKD